MHRYAAYSWTLALFMASLPTGLCLAQDGASEQDAEPAEVTIGSRGSDQDPLAGREPVVSVEPISEKPAKTQVSVGLPSLGIKLDKRVLGAAPGEALPPLRREGETLRKRNGKLLPTGDRGYAVFIAEADPDAGDDQRVAMVLSPCMTLEAMERMHEDRGDSLRFTVTGIVHTYRGVNYLLPTSQPRPWLLEDDAAQDGPEQTEVKQDPETSTPTEATDQKPDPKTQPTADDVLEELLEQRDDAPSGNKPAKGAATGSEQVDDPIAPQTTSQGASRLTDPLLLGLDPDTPQAKLKPEGQFIIARAGRLVRSADGSQALFVLDADRRGAPEPPMILHACKLLETMEQTVLKEGEDVPFIVTGQVFVYRGANYLLPSIVTREFDRGNLE